MLSSTATTTIDRDETEELGKALGLDFALTFLFLPRPFASANKPAEEDPPEKVLLDAKKTGSDLIKKEFDEEGPITTIPITPETKKLNLHVVVSDLQLNDVDEGLAQYAASAKMVIDGNYDDQTTFHFEQPIDVQFLSEEVVNYEIITHTKLLLTNSFSLQSSGQITNLTIVVNSYSRDPNTGRSVADYTNSYPVNVASNIAYHVEDNENISISLNQSNLNSLSYIATSVIPPTSIVYHRGMGLNYFGARYYDAEIGVWTSTDPADQFWSAYSYASNGTNPIGGIDFDGLTLYVCSATNALGIPGANHAYVWSTVANNGVGMHGSQAFGMQTMNPGNGAENPFDEFGNLKPGIKVKEVDLQGRDESEVFNKMNDWPGWNKTPWNPTGAHPGDCHAELEGAFIDAGVKYPGAPNGRLDWNDAFNSGLRGMQGWEQNVSGGLVNPPVWPVYVKGGITPFGLYKALGTAELNAAVLSVSAVAALASNMAMTIGLGAASVGPACVGVATGQGIQWLGGIIPAVIP